MQNIDFYPVPNIYSYNFCGVNEPHAASINNKVSLVFLLRAAEGHGQPSQGERQRG